MIKSVIRVTGAVLFALSSVLAIAPRLQAADALPSASNQSPCTATGASAADDVSSAATDMELLGLRTRTARTYRLANGDLQQIIGQSSLNYQDAKGAWQPIDDTLVPSGIRGYAYQNKANAYTVGFPADLSTAPVKVTMGEAFVAFSLNGGTGTPTNCGAVATYANVLPGVSLSYLADRDAMRELLTLASPSAPASYTFAVQASAGLSARTNAAGGIEFVDGAGTVRFAFSAPVMFDSAKPHPAISHAATLQLASAATGWTVTLAADPTWLHDPARQYPVVIDPDVNTSPLPVAGGQDCYIASGSPATVRCSPGYALNSVAWYPATGGNHALLQFDVGGLNANMQVTGAAVHMALYELEDENGDAATGAETVSVRRLKKPWAAGGVTWNSTGTAAGNWATPGAVGSGNMDTASPDDTERVGNDGNESSGTAADATAYNCTSGYLCAWNVTSMVQGWINGSFPNDGMLFEDDQAPDSLTMYFCTSFVSAQCVAGRQPYLVIRYTDAGTPKPTEPKTTTLAPSSAPAGGTGFALTVNGTNFLSGATVLWNGASRPTVFVSDTQLQATIAASDVQAPGTASITVRNPDGTISMPALAFAITVAAQPDTRPGGATSGAPPVAPAVRSGPNQGGTPDPMPTGR